MMKKLLALLIIAIIVACAPLALAAPPELSAEQAAEQLFAMGLLRGDGSGDLALDDPCDRLQGAVLFTRLLGQEAEALTHPRSHPFRDITPGHWAAPYLGYLYNYGLAYGVASQEYGMGPMQPQQFATFCLRALGYTEGAELSDFQWSEALDFMVTQGIISGSQRNQLRSTPLFRRGDAALLAYATLAAPLKESGQSLIESLTVSGALTAAQAAAFAAHPADLRLAYPAGLLDEETLRQVAAGLGLSVTGREYQPGPDTEAELYGLLRQPEGRYDLCVLPGYLVQSLREGGHLARLNLRDYGGAEAFLPLLSDNPFGRDAATGYYYALPLAVELPLLYFDSAQVSSPEWGSLFRDIYSGGAYLPADSAQLIPLALHYYGMPAATREEKELTPALALLSRQLPKTPALMQQHMLDIAETEGAVLGVISSRELPELERRQQQNSAYASWRAVLPPGGGPASVYYAVLVKTGESAKAAILLKGLLQPQIAATQAQQGGYFPALRGAGEYLSGAMAAAYPTARWESCRQLELSPENRLFYQQALRGALLGAAQEQQQPALASLEFRFSRDGQIYRSCSVDLVARRSASYLLGAGESELAQTATRQLGEAQTKAAHKELARLGLAYWPGFYDGPGEQDSWELTLNLADGSQKTFGGLSLPPLWPELSMALLALTGEEILPQTL